jgi:hypothetical protein
MMDQIRGDRALQSNAAVHVRILLAGAPTTVA